MSVDWSVRNKPVAADTRMEYGPLPYGAELYSFWVVRTEDVLAMKTFKPHQQLLGEGKLVRWTPETVGPVAFISHQWLGWGHPDPMQIQLTLLKRAIRRARSDRYRGAILDNDLDTFERGINKTSTRDDECKFGEKGLEEWAHSGYIWYDFFCCPQEVKGLPDHREEFLRCTYSLPFYIQRCELFMIIAPPVQHTSMTLPSGEKVHCDLRSWSERGWCRLEVLLRTLYWPAGEGIFTLDQGTLFRRLPPRVTFNLPVAFGSFSCCQRNHIVPHFDRKTGQTINVPVLCDKVLAMQIIDSALRERLAMIEEAFTLRRDSLTPRNKHRMRCTIAAACFASLGLSSKSVSQEQVLRAQGYPNSASSSDVEILAHFHRAFFFEPGKPEACAFGFSPLHYAVMSGNADVVEAMVKAEAQMCPGGEATTKSGDYCGEGSVRMGYSTIMGLAIYHGWDLPNSWRILTALRRAGHSPTQRCAGNLTLLHTVASVGREGLLPFFFPRESVETDDNDRALASTTSDQSGVYLDVDDSANYWKVTPLHIACLEGREACVRDLVARGADVNARFALDKSCLHAAAESVWCGHGVIDFLCGQCAIRPNDITLRPEKFDYLFSTIISACWMSVKLNGMSKSSKLIGDLSLIAGGETPLHMAASVGSYTKVSALLRHGASVHARNRRGQTARDWALTNNPYVSASLIALFTGVPTQQNFALTTATTSSHTMAVNKEDGPTRVEMVEVVDGNSMMEISSESDELSSGDDGDRTIQTKKRRESGEGIESRVALREAQMKIEGAFALAASPKHVLRSLLRGSHVHQSLDYTNSAVAMAEHHWRVGESRLRYPEESVQSAVMLVPELRLFMAEHKMNNGTVLIVGEGSGCHVNYFAKAFPDATFFPTDADPHSVDAINRATVAERGPFVVGDQAGYDTLAGAAAASHAVARQAASYPSSAHAGNVLEAKQLDISSEAWELPFAKCDLICAFSVLEYSESDCVEGLFRGASELMSSEGLLMIYGHLTFSGIDISKEKRRAGTDLDLDELYKAACRHSMELDSICVLPGFMFLTTWKHFRKGAGSDPGPRFTRKVRGVGWAGDIAQSAGIGGGDGGGSDFAVPMTNLALPAPSNTAAHVTTAAHAAASSMPPANVGFVHTNVPMPKLVLPRDDPIFAPILAAQRRTPPAPGHRHVLMAPTTWKEAEAFARKVTRDNTIRFVPDTHSVSRRFEGRWELCAQTNLDEFVVGQMKSATENGFLYLTISMLRMMGYSASLWKGWFPRYIDFEVERSGTDASMPAGHFPRIKETMHLPKWASYLAGTPILSVAGRIDGSNALFHVPAASSKASRMYLDHKGRLHLCQFRLEDDGIFHAELQWYAVYEVNEGGDTLTTHHYTVDKPVGASTLRRRVKVHVHP